MTPEEFKAAYTLGHILTGEGVKTSLAQEIRKGRLVMVHELSTTTADEQRRLAILIAQLGPKDRALVIGDVDVEGFQVLVTKYLPGFTTLREWLEKSVAASSTVVADTKDNPSTMDLAVHDTPKAYPSPASVPVVPSLEDTTVRPSMKRAEPVHAEPAHEEPAHEPPASAEPPSATPGTGTPDEATTSFTQLFGAGDGPPALTPPRATRPAAPEHPAAPEPRAGELRNMSAEFEILFGETDAPQAGAKESPSAAPTSPPEDAITDSPTAPVPSPEQVRRAPVSPAAPGESFTLLFGPDATPRVPGGSSSVPPGRAQEAPPAPSMEAPLPGPTPEGRGGAPLAAPRLVSSRSPDQSAPVVSPAPKGPAPPRLKLDSLGGAPPRPEVPRPGAPAPDLVPRQFAERSGFPMVPPIDAGESSGSAVFVPEPMTTDPRKSVISPSPNATAAPLEGSYTEVLTPARLPQAAAPPPPPSGGSGAPAPPRPSYTPLIITLSILILVAVAIVVVILLLKK